LGEAALNLNEETIEDGTESGAPAVDSMMEALRIAEALVFASATPVEEAELAKHIPEGLDLEQVMQELRGQYSGRGFNLVRVAKKWTFRTAADLGWLLSRETTQQKKLSRAALETLAICAYHQPVTRADIEEIRGVAISKGTLDVLLETGWVRLRGRRKSPGRPVTYGTTEEFLLHFGLENISDLPGLDELKGAGLFDGRLPPGFGVPTPNDNPELTEDEDPLEDEVDLFDIGEHGDEDDGAIQPTEMTGDAVQEPDGLEEPRAESAPGEDSADGAPEMPDAASDEGKG